MELRYGGTIENTVIRGYQLYGFYDLGTIWNQGVSDPTHRQSLASAGGGIRLALSHNLSFSVEIAKPLTRPVAAEGGKPVRVFASLSAGF